jgi:hypothetical protein
MRTDIGGGSMGYRGRGFGICGSSRSIGVEIAVDGMSSTTGMDKCDWRIKLGSSGRGGHICVTRVGQVQISAGSRMFQRCRSAETKLTIWNNAPSGRVNGGNDGRWVIAINGLMIHVG